MSYRELRNFTEIMRCLGYPRLISMENFRKPNFELVADILYWMVKLYDPDTTIADKIGDEDERVDFLTDIASLLAAKARMKLNTKKLYASDGRAVQEMLKLATLLYKATRCTNRETLDDTPPPPIKIQEVKASRTLASEITQSGAKLYDLLSAETKNRQERLQALRFLDSAGSSSENSKEYQYVERSLRELVDQTRRAVDDVKKEYEEMENEETNLENKIKKKQEELERTEKRLRSLDNVRPQFLEEQDRLEKELQRQYDIYMEKYRNLDYIESELEKYQKAEEERKDEHDRKLRKMREKLLKEEVEVLRGNRHDEVEEEYRPMSLNRSSGAAVDGRPTGARVQGSMHQSHRRGDSSDGSDDDSDMNAGGDDVGSDDSEGSYDDGDLSVNSAARGRGRGAGRNHVGSDDDGEFLDDDDDDMDGEDEDDDSGSDEHF